MKKVFISAAIFLFLAAYAAPVLAAGPWKGKVIDVETKEPLEGAVVLAVWDRYYRTPTGGSTYFYEAKETLTDKDGKFEIPSYTPINLLPIISYIEGPKFIIFKPGYGSFPNHHISPPILGVNPAEFFSTTEVGTEGEMIWKGIGGKTKVTFGIVELPRLKTMEERVRNFPGLHMYDEVNQKAKNYIHLLNIEAIAIGYQPYPTKEGK